MNKTLRTTLIVLAVLVGAAALVWTGFSFSRSTAWGMGGYYPGGMMGYFNGDAADARYGFGMGPGMMMGGYGNSYGLMGPGMMGGWGYNQGETTSPYGYGGFGMMGPGMMMGSSGFGGMMGGWGYNQGEITSPYGYGGMGPGMMGGYGGYGSLSDVDPLSVEETRDAIEAYLASFGNNDLVIEEIMIFDNNAYAIIIEESTGIGAFELLVDPVTKAVFPEYGPNMMWNLKYGMMSSFGGYGMMGPGMMMGGSGFGGMMGSFGNNGMPGLSDGEGLGGSEEMDSGEMEGSEDMTDSDMMSGAGYGESTTTFDVSAELSVTPDEALEAAQSFLDQYYPGVEVSDEITAFYGYYTIDIQQDGEIVGMLSVNGFTRQVFPHTWHGEFIEMSEAH